MSTDWMRWLLVGQDVLLFIVPAFIVARIKSEQPLQWLHLRTGFRWQTVCIAILLMLCAQPGINLLAYLNEQLSLPSFLAPWEEWMKRMEEANAATVAQLLGDHSVGAFVANLLIIGLLAAMSEEILFRGMIQGLLSDRNIHVAVWVSAILFSLMHLQFYGFVPRMLMGALFGYVLVWTGSLWAPILMHFVNNALVVTLSTWLTPISTENAQPTAMWIETIGRESTWWVGILSIVVSLILVRLLYRSH